MERSYFFSRGRRPGARAARPRAALPVTLLAVCALLCAVSAAYAAEGTRGAPGAAVAGVPGYLNVQVRQAQVRAEPSPLSVPLVSLSYGERVLVTGLHDGWAIVALAGRNAPAYMYMSSLTPTRVAPAGSGVSVPGTVPGASGIGATAPEMVLAGKGFGSGDSGASGDASGGSGMQAVDRMEAFAYDPARCALFLQGGG